MYLKYQKWSYPVHQNLNFKSDFSELDRIKEQEYNVIYFIASTSSCFIHSSFLISALFYFFSLMHIGKKNAL